MSSNWHGNKYLNGKTSSQAIDTIENIQNRQQLLTTFDDYDKRGGVCQWALSEWEFEENGKGIYYNHLPTIESLLKAAAKGEEVPQMGVVREMMWWTNFLVTFTESAVACGTSQRLLRISQDLGGFRYYMGGGPTPVGASIKLPRLPPKT